MLSATGADVLECVVHRVLEPAVPDPEEQSARGFGLSQRLVLTKTTG